MVLIRQKRLAKRARLKVTNVGDHEASQAMKIAVNNHHYKLKYSVRKGVAGTLYNLRGQADKEITCSGRWNP
mgnify:CR=1 FL=1